MAIHQHEHHPQHTQSLLLDALYCLEDETPWDQEEEQDRETRENSTLKINNETNLSFLPENDLFWEEEELLSLFIKEKQIHLSLDNAKIDHSLSLARGEAVNWMLKAKSNYGFSVLTGILAINYLDRFLSNFDFQKDKPWMIQLVAVTCLSLAAKVEETQVPLLLDLQVEDTKYVFEAKTIQRMELLVMSTLEWRLNPVTPLSFVDHITRRLGLKTHLHREFFKRCEALLLSVVADSRLVRYLPSVLATATMLHVINQVGPSNLVENQNQLLDLLKTTKEKVNDCYEVIAELSKTCLNDQTKQQKRSFEEIPGSPIGVIDSTFSCDDISNDSWAVCPSSPSSPEPLLKKIRVEKYHLQLPCPGSSFSL